MACNGIWVGLRKRRMDTSKEWYGCEGWNMLWQGYRRLQLSRWGCTGAIVKPQNLFAKFVESRLSIEAVRTLRAMLVEKIRK